jgi:pilus assembly protein CpaF
MTGLIVQMPGDGGPASPDDATITLLRAAVDRRLADAAQNDDPLPVAQAITDALDDHARQALRAGREPLAPETEARVRRTLRDAYQGAAGLQALLDDPDIETININGFDNVWVQRRDGTKARVAPVAASDADLEALLREQGAVAGRRGGHERRFDRGAPELSLQLADGARLHALMDVTDRISASIRLFPPEQDHLADLVRKRELTPVMAALFEAMVRARRNIVVSGGPAAGKTTLLGALAAAIPPQRRVIVIEDTSELRFERRDDRDMTSIQTRMANTEGVGEFDMSRALKASLRMSPDVIIVGEVRGAEVVYMAKAMSIGIDGSMCTVHASDSAQTLLRMIAYAMEPPALYPHGAAVALLASAVDVVIHLDFTPDGTRVVSSVREVADSNGEQIITNEVYRPGPDNRAVPATPLRSDTLERLTAVGFDPRILHQDQW